MNALEETTTQLDPENRKAILAREVAAEIRKGWRVESQTEFQAVLVKGHRPNHLLHLLLSVFTIGLWLIGWLLVAVFAGEKRQVLEVDVYGNAIKRG